MLEIPPVNSPEIAVKIWFFDVYRGKKYPKGISIVAERLRILASHKVAGNLPQKFSRPGGTADLSTISSRCSVTKTEALSEGGKVPTSQFPSQIKIVAPSNFAVSIPIIIFQYLNMPSTRLSLHFHVIFSTKDRHPLIASPWRPRLHEYFGGLIRTAGGIPEAIGGTADHVHLLVVLRATHALATFVQDIKQTSSRWIWAADKPLKQGVNKMPVDPHSCRDSNPLTF